MPYIIEINRLAFTTPETPNGEHSAHDVSTRTAVATLDEARDYTFNARVNDDGQIEPLPESGGTVGPLPDGTVIEVRQVDWMDFERLVVPGPVAAAVPITTFDDDDYRAGLIVAFNAA